MSDLLPPYTPVNTPVKETVPFDGADFKTTFWNVPEGTEVKGRVVFVHGFSEYDAVYVQFFDSLSSAGYEVSFFDQRGSGLTSTGKAKGITNEHHVFKDLDFFIKKNLDEIADRPNNKIFLLGHSMGGSITLNYCVKGTYKDFIRASLVNGPLISNHPSTKPSKLLVFAATLAMRIVPNMKIDTGLKPEYITTDPNWKEFVAKDPIINPLIGSLRQINDFLEYGERLKNPAYIKNCTVPTYILHGKDDKINDPAASQQVYDLIPLQDKKLTLIDGGRHSLFIESEEIYQDVVKKTLEWLAQH